ncbi:MAG: hypothetical protein Q7J98_09700 [Kiritimatiellia bacterium]|nr:hypothetical protein [Kiritimatiellia bacterium]
MKTKAPSPGNNPAVHCESRPRTDFFTPDSPQGLRVVQITTDATQAYMGVYPETPVFTPDSKRFIFLHMGDRPLDALTWRNRRNLMLCEIENGFAIRRLTEESSAKGNVVSPDGKYAYYFVDCTVPGGGVLSFKRISLENYVSETLLVLDAGLPGTKIFPNQYYGLATISGDGQRVAISACLADPQKAEARYGVLVFEVAKGTVNLVFEQPEFSNTHLQYCQSRDPEASHDLLIQHNHRPRTDQEIEKDSGTDLHLIRDDGTNWRNLPFARLGYEFCGGHQAWRGKRMSVIAQVFSCLDPQKPDVWEARLIEGWPYPADLKNHTGANSPLVCRNDLTPQACDPCIGHFAVDQTGNHVVFEVLPANKTQKELEQGILEFRRLWVGTIIRGKDGRETIVARYLLTPRSSQKYGQASHPHPFFSPDARRIFFNSDVDGYPHVFMVEGFELP